MLLRRDALDAILRGEVDLAFRRWERPRVVAGTRMRTPVGLIEVLAVEPIAARDIDAAQARRAGFGSRAALLRMLQGRTGRIHRVTLRAAGPDPRQALRADAELSPATVAALVARLDRYDAASAFGPWTAATLAAIEAEPGRRAPELAAAQGRETAPFKRDVRKLKELGLTESLEVGYRLSPRGAAFLAAVRG